MSHGKVDHRDLERRMDGALSVLKTELSGLRTGRASATLLDPVMVNAYGSQMPLNQVGTVSENDLREIAELKMPDLNAYDIEAAMKIVEGTAKSCGLTIGK